MKYSNLLISFTISLYLYNVLLPQILTLCTELYIIAYRLRSKTHGIEGMVTMGLLTLQTAVLFLEVSLAGAEVQEVVSYERNSLRFLKVYRQDYNFISPTLF